MCTWEEVYLKDLCSSVSEKYKGDDNKVILINTSDILNGEFLNSTLVENKNLKGQFKKTFKKNDILYSEIRPNNKRFAYVDFEDTSNYIASTKLMVIRVNDRILPRYLYYFLTSKGILKKLQDLAETRSGTFPQITFSEEVSSLKINLPNKVTQEKIASFINSIDSKIKLNKKINDNLLKISNLLYLNSFPYSIYDNLPKGWRIGNLGEIISIHDSKRIPLSGNQRDSMKNKIYPYYGAASLMDYVENFIFDGKYLLVGEDGTVVDNKGFPILQYVWGKFWVNNHAHILTGKNGFNVESLFILLKHTNVTNIVTGAVQPKISQTNLKSFPIVIPPLEHIEKYNDTILPIFKKIRANSEENEYLVNLREVLLAKLFSAEIDLSNI